MARLSRRKSTPQSPTKVRSAPTSPRQIRRSTRTQSHEPNQLASSAPQDPQKLLDPVLEEGDTIAVRTSEPVDEAVEREDAAGLDEAEADDEDFDDYSASEDEDLAGLDKDLIIDNLSAINLDTDDIFRLLQSSSASDVSENIQNPLTPTAKRLNHFVRRLLNNLEPCGCESLLQPSRLSYLLTKGDLPGAELSAATDSEQIFMKANLALFIVKLLQGRWSDQDTLLDDLLSYLAEIQTFPTPFFHRDQAGEIPLTTFKRDFKQATLNLGISLLTQCYIRHALKNSVENDFDANTLLVAVFLQGDHEKVRDVSLGVSAVKSKAALTKAIESRVHEIRKFFTPGEGIGIDFEGLSRTFPAKEFVEDALSWTITRRQQLDQAIEEQGGIETIRDGLLNSQAVAITTPKIQRRKSRKSREARALEEGASFLRNVDDFLDATAATETPSHEQEVQDVVPELPQIAAATPRRRNEVAETPQPDDPLRQPLHEQDAEQAPPLNYGDNSNIINDDMQSTAGLPTSAQQPQGSTQDVLARSDRQQAIANKENIPQQRSRLYDRQATATREDFDSPGPAPRNSGKRAHRATEASDDEDDFETDTRNNKRQRTYHGKAPVRQSREDDDPGMFIPDNKDPREQHIMPPPSTAPQHRVGPSSSRPSHFRSPSSFSSSTAPAATYESYLRTKEQAKANMGTTTALLPPSTNPSTNLQAGYPSHQTIHGQVQVRRPWTPGEIERLIQLIQQYQTQWSKMLKVDAQMDVPMLQNRTQVQLKDKARNMKLDYLKAEMELPAGFEGVTVSKAHKETFRRLGIAVEEDFAPSEA